MDAATSLRATVVVVPRERFSVAVESLESILSDRATPFDLVYVDGGSPRSLRSYLRKASAEHGFTLISRDYYLPPNHARNLGLAQVKTDYVIFIDNDVIVSPGWIAPLVDCADATGAAIVSPLICQGRPLHGIVHCAGGSCSIEPARRKGDSGMQVIDRIDGQGFKVDDLRPGLHRMRTGIAEYHCVLVRTDFLRGVGGLDAEMLSTREHLDLCLEALTRGHEIWIEPGSVVTYLYDLPMRLGDLPYYMLRWSDDWERRSLIRFQEKWRLGDGGPTGYRLRHLGQRRVVRLLHPRVGKLTARLSPWLRRAVERGCVAAERRFNGLLASVNRWRTASEA